MLISQFENTLPKTTLGLLMSKDFKGLSEVAMLGDAIAIINASVITIFESQNHVP